MSPFFHILWHSEHRWQRIWPYLGVLVLGLLVVVAAVLRRTAEQMDPVQRWYRILSQALRRFLHGRQLIPPARLEPA